MAPEDPNYKCNLDILLAAMTAKVSIDSLKDTFFTDFFESYKETSIFGLKVELLNE